MLQTASRRLLAAIIPTRAKLSWARAQVMTSLRELRTPTSLILLVLTIFLSIACALAAPSQTVTVCDQPVQVGLRSPGLGWTGSAEIVLDGNAMETPFKLWGPIRPQLQFPDGIQPNKCIGQLLKPDGGPARTDAMVALFVGFLRWFGLASLMGLVAASLIVSALAHWRWHTPDYHKSRMVLTYVIAGGLLWVACLGSAVVGSHQLAGVRSLGDLVGYSVALPETKPAGSPIKGYRGVVLGDSRVARLGGPEVEHKCSRSSDALAQILSQATGKRYLNAACTSATLNSFWGNQRRNGQTIAPQLGVAKQIEDLEEVHVVIGPNDVGWTFVMGVCYSQARCDDNFTMSQYRSQKSKFVANYSRLLRELDSLPTHPKVVIGLSYTALEPDAADTDPKCPDLIGRNGNRLDERKLSMLNSLNQDLNQILTTGAENHGFAVALPHLTPLCKPSGNGPDILPLSDPNKFHPTVTGEFKIGMAHLMAIADYPKPKTDGAESGAPDQTKALTQSG